MKKASFRLQQSLYDENALISNLKEELSLFSSTIAKNAAK